MYLLGILGRYMKEFSFLHNNAYIPTSWEMVSNEIVKGRSEKQVLIR